MTETANSTVMFNPFMPGFTDDPYPHYAEIRADNPIQQHPLGFWFLAGMRQVSTLLRSGLSVEEKYVKPTPMTQLRQQFDVERPAGGMSMLDRDPPDHTRLRKLVSKVFTPRAIAALAPEITELVDESLTRIEFAGEADLVEELAFPLPFTVISRMLGMPSTDHVKLRELTGTMVRSVEPVTDPEVLQAISRAEQGVWELVADMIRWKRDHPADDLLTGLITAEDNGDVLSDDELVAQVSLLYVAGHETTVNLISNGVLALLRNPEQLALLRARPELAENAIEEMLRYDSPVQQTRRVTTDAITISGQEIPAGMFVVACMGSANRDEQFFGEDAERFRIERQNARQHLSFGSGVHHCLGAALARLEGRIAIERLVGRFDRLRLAGEPQFNGRINLRGVAKLPIAV